MGDLELLRDYAARGSQEAFAEVARRHVDWVYAAARRMTGDPALAEDVTQGVFLVLARKAGRLGAGVRLTGWLFRATQLAVKDALKMKARRERREREAAMMRERVTSGSEEAGWEEVVGRLDAAVASLATSDREAILTRFYQAQSMAEVGAVLGVSEEAAKKRVARAVEKLRRMLEAEGVAMSGGGLAVMLGERLLEQVPAGLVEAVGSGGAASAGAGVVAKGVGQAMAWAKVKVAAAVLAGAVVTAGGAAVVAGAGAGGQVEQKPVQVEVADPLPSPVGELAQPTWPADGDLQLMQVSVAVDAKVVEKLRTVGQRIANEGSGYEAMKIDPELVLHYLRMARKADLAYLPDDMWYRWNSPVLVDDAETLMNFESFTPWRGERVQLRMERRMTNAIGQEIRLAQGELRLDVPNLQVTLNGVMQTGSLKLRTKVVAGDGLALIGRIGQVKAGEIWHLLLYQVISATPEEVANYREMRDVVNWIEHGTAAEQKLVQQAVLWQERAKGTTPDKRWMKDLPGGARVELLGVANPELNPYCWWTGDGKPAMPGHRRATPRLSAAEQRENLAEVWVSVSHPNGWFSRKADVSWYTVQQDQAIEVITGSGAFKTMATLKPEVGQRAMVDGQPFAVQRISGSGMSCSLQMEYTFFKDLDVRVVAVDGNGKEQESSRMQVSGGGKTVTLPDINVWFPVSPKQIKELRVQTRPMYRVRFEGLALEPVEELPEVGGEADIQVGAGAVR